MFHVPCTNLLLNLCSRNVLYLSVFRFPWRYHFIINFGIRLLFIRCAYGKVTTMTNKLPVFALYHFFLHLWSFLDIWNVDLRIASISSASIFFLCLPVNLHVSVSFFIDFSFHLVVSQIRSLTKRIQNWKFYFWLIFANFRQFKVLCLKAIY